MDSGNAKYVEADTPKFGPASQMEFVDRDATLTELVVAVLVHDPHA